MKPKIYRNPGINKHFEVDILGQCAFLILVMAVFWVTECIPLPVTALLPIVPLPLLNIMTTNDVCITYFKESNMMFIGW